MHIEVRAFLSLFLSALAMIVSGWVSLVSIPLVVLFGERNKFPCQRVAALGVCKSVIARKVIRRLMKGEANGRAIFAEFDEVGEDAARGLRFRLEEQGLHAECFSGLAQDELCVILEDMSPNVFLLEVTDNVSTWFRPLMTVVSAMRGKRKGLIVIFASDASASMARVFSDGLRGLIEPDGVSITLAPITSSDFDDSVIDSIKRGHPLVVYPLCITDLVSDSLLPFRTLVN